MTIFRGFEGVVTVFVVGICVWAFCYFTKKFLTYNMEPAGKPGLFELLLQKYLRLAEYTVGLATGSIVLLVGSSAFHGKDGRLPTFYASPLLVLGGSVLAGIGFMAILILNYEMVQHGNPHTRAAYALIETLGFTSLLLFVIGYIWLIWSVTG